MKRVVSHAEAADQDVVRASCDAEKLFFDRDKSAGARGASFTGEAAPTHGDAVFSNHAPDRKRIGNV